MTAEGLPCPHCNEPLTLVNAGTEAGRPYARLDCAACGKQFWPAAMKSPAGVVRGVPTRCPKCGSLNHANNGSRVIGGSKVRRRDQVCRDCGAKFVEHTPAV